MLQIKTNPHNVWIIYLRLHQIMYWSLNSNSVLDVMLCYLLRKWSLSWVLKDIFSSFPFSSVAQSCPTLCDPMNRSMPGLPVHHHLPDFTQTHVHRVSDAIQPSHPLSSPSPPAPNPSQHQSLFQWVNSSHEVAKVLEFQLQHQSFQRNPRADLLQNGLVGPPCSPRDSQESSPAPQFKSINSSVLSLLHSPTLTSIHDHRKNHSLRGMQIKATMRCYLTPVRMAIIKKSVNNKCWRGCGEKGTFL